MNTGLNTFQGMGSCAIVDWPGEERVKHTQIMLKKKNNENGAICKYKARLEACSNEEVDCQQEIPTAVYHCSVVNLIFSL